MAAIPNRGRLPSILLAQKPRFTASTNDTTATAESEGGYTMAVSFWMANPPELSLFSIHCSKPHDLQHRKHSNFSILPHVVAAAGPFVLLRAAFYARSFLPEYFLYKAGDPPSLERIPSPDESDDLQERELGILGQGGGGHYLLADLRDAPSSESDDGYQLRIYSSGTKSWSTMTLGNPCPGVDRVIPDKVITLGQGSLGWVDLSRGMLVCDLLLLLRATSRSRPPVPGAVSFIPLPEPLPGNRYKLTYPTPPTQKMKEHPSASRSASWFRDLACVNGVLKFVEMENPTSPGSEDNIIHDSDLIMSLKQRAIDANSKKQLWSFRDAWRAVTWTRETREVSSSSNFWCQTSSARFADIKDIFTNLHSTFPIISPDDDTILYLKSVEDPSRPDGVVAALDFGNMALKAIRRLPESFYYSPGYDRRHPFRACTLSRHLNMTSGNQVSECHKITEDSSSANHPSKTSIRVGSCEPTTTIQRLSELARKLKRPRNAAESIIQNDHISQVHPIENNLPQWHKWDAPPGNSLWPHQNNLPPQQCFNNPNGPCGPGYASLAPVHGGYNYQPQLTSSSEFKPHEAPQPCFNCCNVASYHGYLQQLSAPNSFAYGAHTSYGNYQQQWQQLPPTVELPIAVQRQPTPLE